MNLWKKLGLSIYSTTPCRACGTSLGIEKAGTGGFIWGWLPFSLSGLFPFPAKIVLGCLGIGLIFAPHLFFIPLVQKTSEIKRTPPRGMLLWLSIVFLTMFASDWINLLPSTQTKIIALLVSAVLTFPVIKTVWDRIPKADEKFLAFGAGYLLVAGMHYFALSIVPPALATHIWGEQSISSATVVRKRHSNKLTRCANKAEIIFADDHKKHEICLSEQSWKQIENGSAIAVKIQGTSYGRLVTEVEALGIDNAFPK